MANRLAAEYHQQVYPYRVFIRYRHSTSTDHAPTVLHKLEECDSDLAQVIAEKRVAPEASLDYAVARFQEVLRWIRHVARSG